MLPKLLWSMKVPLYFSRQWHVAFVSVPGGFFNRMTFSFALERIFQSLFCLESRKPYNCQLQVSQMGNEEKTLKTIAATTTKKNKKIFQLIYQSNRLLFFFLAHFREYEQKLFSEHTCCCCLIGYFQIIPLFGAQKPVFCIFRQAVILLSMKFLH